MIKWLKNNFSFDSKSNLSKFKSSIIAIILGFLIGAIVIFVMGGNPITAYVEMFKSPFNALSYRTTFMQISMFILLGAGIGISFKTGLFNIGAAGQFLGAGMTTVVLGIMFNINKGIAIPLLIIVALLVGAIIAGFAGFLKAFFNVHEVVSTIMLNWIVFYFVKYINGLPTITSPTTASSKPVNETMKFSLLSNSSDYIIVVIIAIVIALALFIMFKYTTLGYRMRVNGLSQGAAKYGGINAKANTIIAMMLSGSLSGLAGFIFYNCINGSMTSLDTSLPSQGFDAITVTLLAFSSPLGSIPAGAFYAVMLMGTSGAGLVSGVSAETIRLTLALIIFFAALSNKFVTFRPFEYIKQKIWIYKFKEKEQYIKKYLKNMERERVFFRKSIKKEVPLTKQELIIFKKMKNKINKSLKEVHNKDTTSKIYLNLIKNKTKDAILEFEKNKIFRYEAKKYILNLLIKQSIVEKKIVSNNLKAKKISIIDAEQEKMNIDRKIVDFSTNYDLNAYKDLIKNHKIIIKDNKKAINIELKKLYLSFLAKRKQIKLTLVKGGK